MDELDVMSAWPSMGDEKYCSDCIHWGKKMKTHGKRQCTCRDTHYCLAHGKCYWKRKTKFKPFLTKKDFQL